MMLASDLLKTAPAAPRPHRLRRCAEGVSLWLAVLLMLFVHPLYAEAATKAPARTPESATEWRLPTSEVSDAGAIRPLAVVQWPLSRRPGA